MNHTKEPWVIEENEYSTRIVTEDGQSLLFTGISTPRSSGRNDDIARANTKRAAMCVNVCKSISDGHLKLIQSLDVDIFNDNVFSKRLKLEKEKNDCLEALKDLLASARIFVDYTPATSDEEKLAVAVSKAEKVLENLK